MRFLDAVVEISKRDDLDLCEHEHELDGLHPNICVYKDGLFAGKLRWPQDGRKAEVDEELEIELNMGRPA